MVRQSAVGSVRARGRGAGAARRSRCRGQTFGCRRGGERAGRSVGSRAAAGDFRCRLLPAKHAARMSDEATNRDNA